MGARSRPLMVRFWSKVRMMDDGCWLWTGSVAPGSSPQIQGGPGQKNLAVSHVAFGRPVPPGHYVQQTCASGPCVNPSHLRLRSRAEDAAAKLAPCARFNTTEVSAIWRRLKAGTSQSEIARQLGVTRAVINDIAVGKTWRSVTGGSLAGGTLWDRRALTASTKQEGK